MLGLELTFICNAGLALTYAGKTLVIDAPNMDHPPFRYLTDEAWDDICKRMDICGFFYSHDHPDHLDRQRLLSYLDKRQDAMCYIPYESSGGRMDIGPFRINYHPIPHAPLPDAPPHLVALIEAGDKAVYIAADAALETALHRDVLCGRRVDAAIWTPMYLSRADTRMLMAEVAAYNYIYHMPARPDMGGMWKKCEKNFERYGEALTGVRVIENYPETIVI